MEIAGVAPPLETTGAVPVTLATVPVPFPLKVLQSVELRYPFCVELACGIEIAGVVPPVDTTGDEAVTAVTVPLAIDWVVQFTPSQTTNTVAPFATATLVPPVTVTLMVCPPVVSFLTNQLNTPVFGTSRFRVAVSVGVLVRMIVPPDPLISG